MDDNQTISYSHKIDVCKLIVHDTVQNTLKDLSNSSNTKVKTRDLGFHSGQQVF